MSLHIKRASLTSKEALRVLLIESLMTFMGKCAVVDKALPCTGRPILLLDSAKRLTLLCFDIHNPGKVLLDGISAWEECNTTRPWMNRHYSAHTDDIGDYGINLALVINSKPPGIDLLLRNNHHVKVFLFQAIQVNNETGLLIEPYDGQQQRTAHEQPLPDPMSIDSNDDLLGEIALTEEENEFFKTS